ncbi:hypothetical protein ATANTOWER_013518 [Ataeniobius toweri]|uniref:Uncharacterized protein n=1 Tax=Ataeniobius toweri TaxID=208326 RepID=A0ABU7AB42_9TELE|nr:hypothetical protein [Ataeniobius toweri]
MLKRCFQNFTMRSWNSSTTSSSLLVSPFLTVMMDFFSSPEVEVSVAHCKKVIMLLEACLSVGTAVVLQVSHSPYAQAFESKLHTIASANCSRFLVHKSPHL